MPDVAYVPVIAGVPSIVGVPAVASVLSITGVLAAADVPFFCWRPFFSLRPCLAVAIDVNVLTASGVLMLPLHFLASLPLPASLLQASLLLQAHSSCCRRPADAANLAFAGVLRTNCCLLSFHAVFLHCSLSLKQFCFEIFHFSCFRNYWWLWLADHLEISVSFLAL